jgi:hypothetical protein
MYYYEKSLECGLKAGNEQYREITDITIDQSKIPESCLTEKKKKREVVTYLMLVLLLCGFGYR